MGEMGTLWLALAFCFAGGVIAMISLRHVKTPGHMHNLTPREKFAELSRAVTLLYTNRNIFLSSIVRIINTLSLFGFAVIMPMMFVDELGFTTSEWLQVWAAFFFTTIFSNIFWGIVAEKMGWDVSFEKYSTNDSPVVNGRFQEYNHVSLNKTVKEDKDLDRKYLYFTTITIEKKTIISGSSGHLEEEKALVADPVVKNGRTLLGIRDLANGLNADVQWDGARKEVKLTTKPVEQYPNYDKLLKYIEEYRKAVGEQTDNQKEQQKEQQEQQKQEEAAVKDESSYADEVIRLVNKEREKAGLSSLEANKELTSAAEVRAKEISKVFGHTRPDGNSFNTAAKEAGFDGDYIGENIAGGRMTPADVVEGWMNSEGHRKNILRPEYNYIGVAYLHKSNSEYGRYWVQIFAR